MDSNNQDFTKDFYKYLLDNTSLQENIHVLCNYLSEHIPCDKITLSEMDRNLLERHIIFEYTPDSYTFKPRIKNMPYVWPIEDIISHFENFQKIKYLKDVRTSKFYARYAAMHPGHNSSLEYCFCSDSTYQKHQILTLTSKRIDAFTKEHIKIIRQLQPVIHSICVQLLNIYNEHRLNLLSFHTLAADPEKLLQQCPGLTEMNNQIQNIASTNSTVLIYGETGVGKELVADTICSLSSRSDQTFQKINCGALTSSLIDSELFGVVKGAYTGAVETKKGIFESAHGGTLYLDEVGELSLDAQVRLLRVLEAREIRRVGDTKRIPVDVRIIAATNKNIETMVAEGIFRGDLLYRLSVIPLYVPSLAERPEDIPILAQYFYTNLIQELEMVNPPLLTQKTLQELMETPWPGNVRQLRHSIERSLILGKNQKELHITNPQQHKAIVPNVSTPSVSAPNVPANIPSTNSKKLLQQCPNLAKINNQIQNIASTNSTVLIYGETGVGKELVANTIHSLSSRSKQIFLKINCRTLTPKLIEGELRDMIKNVRTDAMEIKKGIFENAHGGTLCLDDIGELSLEAQASLLGVLETREAYRTGHTDCTDCTDCTDDTKTIPINVHADVCIDVHIDVRIIAITNKDLDIMVAKGTFERNLLYHLSVIPLYVPSLAERPEDIPVLARYFYNILIQQLAMPTAPKLTEETFQQLLDRSWAGNIRQLRYTIERSLILGKNQKELNIIDSTPIIIPKIKQNSKTYTSIPIHTKGANTPEYYEILSALRRSHGRIDGPLGAADALEINPSTLRYKMKKYAIVKQKK